MKTDLKALLVVVVGVSACNGVGAVPSAPVAVSAKVSASPSAVVTTTPSTATPMSATAIITPTTTVTTPTTAAVVIQPATANTPTNAAILPPAGGVMSPGGVGGQLLPGSAPGGQLSPGVIPGGTMSLPPLFPAVIGTSVGTLNYGVSAVSSASPARVIVTGGGPTTAPGGTILGTGIGGTSTVIITGGTPNNYLPVQSSGRVIVAGGALTGGGVGGTNAPTRSQ